MAAGDHEKEDDEEYPIGFRFKPTDAELVKYYLVPSLRRQRIAPNDFITVYNVYAYHPDTLTKMHRSVDQEEWYFLSSRTRKYENGVRPARKTRDERGRWKASTASKEVDQKVVCNGITFCRSVLNYFEGVPNNEVRTKWMMLELKVPCFEIKLDKARPSEKLDEYVLCKIYVSPQHKRRVGADLRGTRSACERDQDLTQRGQAATAGSMLSSRKQAGKRPMLDKVRRGSQGVASAQQASCPNSSAPRTRQVSTGAPGQAPAPQTMPQRQVGAQRLVQLPTQQTPVSFGQTTAAATTTTRPPAPVNLGYPGNPPRRHPGWAWPHVSLQCYYDQNYRGVKPPEAGNASSSQPQMPASSSSSFLPPPPPQQPFFNGDANRRGGEAVAAASTPYGSYPYQSRSLTLEAAGQDGAANGSNGAPRVNANINDEQFFVDLAMTTSNPSLMTGARTQTAPAPPPPAAAVKVETETGETFGFNKKDAV